MELMNSTPRYGTFEEVARQGRSSICCVPDYADSVTLSNHNRRTSTISGVGHGKALKFGADFIDLIANYVEENDIERPLDMVVKSVVNKSSNKVYIIQSIDRKRDLNDVADAKGLSMDDLLTEIEHILSSGTKINLDYYIDEEIDETNKRKFTLFP